jgi:Copper chaperone
MFFELNAGTENDAEANKISKKTKTNNIMSERTLQIKGMSCGHCSARVEKVLNAIDGVEAKVDLETNSAQVTLTKEVSDEALKSAVDGIGYEVVSFN